MKLALKFAISFMIVTVLVWGVASYVRVEREINLFEHDILRDHESIGLDLAAAVADIWELGGEAAAHNYVQKANESKSNVSIRLLHIDSVLKSPPVLLSEEAIGGLEGLLSKPAALLYEDDSGEQWTYTYVAVPVRDTTPLMIELSESLAEKDSYIASTVQRAVFYTIIMGLLAGAGAMLLGMMFIARPVRILIRKARRVAEGDLRGDVELRQRDEMGELGIELNAMSARLAEARHRVAVESAARKATVAQLRHADRLTTVGKLSAAIAHELGTPLNVIKARARMIAEEEVEGEAAVSSGKTIFEQSERMSRIIRDLLNFSRRDVPQHEPVDIRLIVNQALDLIKPMARKKRVDISVESQPAPVRVMVDTDQIRQVLLNIIVNALDAMPEGGRLNVAVDIRQSNDKPTGRIAVIRVTDSGAGILKEDLSRLFDPFFTTKDRQTGTGLGLSIAADIIDEHGGYIDVESEPGKGSTFSICLPLERENGKEVD